MAQAGSAILAIIGPVRFAEKTSQNTVPVDLLWEKNIVPAEKNKLKSTDYKISEQNL